MTMDQENPPFQLEEATIAEMHEAIRSGKITLVTIVITRGRPLVLTAA